MRKTIRIVTIFIVLTALLSLVGPQAAWAASTLSLSPASASQSVGNIFSVDILLDTGGDAVSGASAIVNYDTTKLQVQDDDSVAAGVQIKQGTIFNQTPLTDTVDTTVGRIRYDSGSLGTSYTGRGVMATIRFKAIAVGVAPVTFVFNSTSTADTSLVAATTGPTNLLTTVQDGSYTITAVSAPPVYLPPTGVVENTLAALIAGILFIAAGLFFRSTAFIGR